VLYRVDVMAAFPYITKAAARTPEDRDKQRWLYAIKGGGRVRLGGESRLAAEWFCLRFQPDSRDRPFLNRDRTLVPIPGAPRTRLPAAPERWPCFDLAQRMAARGWARDARPIVVRETAVRSSRDARSAGAAPPTVAELIGSLAIDAALLPGVTAVTLVDDVVTAGRNAVAACMRLRDVGFQGDVALLAVAHTDHTSGDEGRFYGRLIWPEGRPSSFRRRHQDEDPRWTHPTIGPWSPEPP
jgi:hypothetical protein